MTKAIILKEDSLDIGEILNDCGENKTLIDGQCVCDDSSILLDGGICFKCVPGSFKSGSNCIPCIRNCLSCSDDQSCEKCLDDLAFNTASNTCEE